MALDLKLRSKAPSFGSRIGSSECGHLVRQISGMQHADSDGLEDFVACFREHC